MKDRPAALLPEDADLEATVLCRECRAFGSTATGAPCHICGGTGALRRLVVPIKIVALPDVMTGRVGPVFRRMAILQAERGKTIVLARGVADVGRGVEISMSSRRFDEAGFVEFVERGRVWAP